MNKLITLLVCTLALTLSMVSAPVALTCEQAIQAKVATMYELDTNWYRIEVLDHPLKSAELTPSQISLRPLSQKEPLGLFSMMVGATVDGESVPRGQVRLRIKKFAEVLVLVENVPRTEEISTEKTALRRMEVTTQRERPIVDASTLAGMRAKRNLKRGDIITAGSLEPIPDVEHGRDVAIVYSGGLCRISAEGRAMQSGLAGDYIKVKNKSSGKIILARIVDANAVAVDP